MSEANASKEASSDKEPRDRSPQHSDSAQVDSLMSCFDRDQRVIVTRRRTSASAPPPAEAKTPFLPCSTSALPASDSPGCKAAGVVRRNWKSYAQRGSASLRLRNIQDQLEDTSSDKDRSQLNIEYANCLCDLGRFREAAQRISQHYSAAGANEDSLRHFVKALTKSVVSSIASSAVSLMPKCSSAMSRDQLIFVPMQCCPDPWSCPECFSVLQEPTSLPCGHTYCKKCLMSTPSLRKSCSKCGSAVKLNATIDSLAPNILITKVVEKLWGADLRAAQLRQRGNEYSAQQDFDQAIHYYSKALDLAPNDAFTLSNRSYAYLKNGCATKALEDATLCISARPHWMKGYFRQATAYECLGRLEEAFQSYFTCLTLDEGSSNQMRICMAKVWGQMLSSSKTEPVVPVCLVVLVEYASEHCCGGPASDSVAHLPDWMTQGVRPYRAAMRRVNPECSVEVSDFECPLCFTLLSCPITTPCGHTFCKRCLDRALDHAIKCPLCMSPSVNSYLAERRESSNEFVEECLRKLFPREHAERLQMIEAELKELVGQTHISSANSDVEVCSEMPIFVCTMAFPYVRCPLHVFEPRYRLMIRRSLEIGTRQFGMCCQIELSSPYAEFGTLLEIRDMHIFRDGRSVIDTRGTKRFRVLERRVRDGYHTASVEFIKDIAIPTECLKDVQQLHDETLVQAKTWYQSLAEDMRKGIEHHYGSFPMAESCYWQLANGPTWCWWIVAIMPLEQPAQLHILKQNSLKQRLETISNVLNRVMTTL